MAELKTARTTVRRKADRGRYDRETVDAILDAALIAHVGFAIDGVPSVIPMAYVRIDDAIYFHGAVANHALRTLANGSEACVTVTLLDALVLSRSAFHHSMNYRSVVCFGRGEKVEDDAAKLAAVEALVEQIVPGRREGTRGPSPSELRQTLVVRFPLTEASAKVRTGPPIEDPEDLDLPYWGGEIPLTIVRGDPIPDEYVRHGNGTHP